MNKRKKFSMKQNKKKFSLVTLLCVLAIPASCGIRIAALLRDYDTKYGYFNDNTLIRIGNIMVLAFCVLIAAEALINLKRKNLKPSFDTARTYIPAGLCAAASLFMAKHLFGTALKYAAGNTAALIKLITAAAAVFSLLAVIGFVVFIITLDRFSNARVYASLAISLFLLLSASHIYFDGQFPLNAPNKIIDLVAHVFASLFFLYEARISLGREKWRLYVLFGGVATVLLAYSSIPAITVYFVKGYTVSGSIYESVLSLMLFLFVGARCLMTDLLRHDEPGELVKALSERAKARDAHVAEEDKRFYELYASRGIENEAENDDSQISIVEMLEAARTNDTESIHGGEE